MLNTIDPCQGPFELRRDIPSYEPAKHMCLAHNTYIRALNAIYIQANSVSSPKDIRDFLVYCQCWFEAVSHHHNVEESYFFPEIEKALTKPGMMRVNVDQHEAFHAKLDTWGQQCYDLTSDVTKYDGYTWRKAIEDFSIPLVKHLHDEIDTLIELEQLDTERVIITTITPELERLIVDGADTARVFPMALSASDNTFEGGKYPFPSLPWFVPYMVDWIYARKLRDSWRFAPCTMHSRPRPLPFAKE